MKKISRIKIIKLLAMITTSSLMGLHLHYRLWIAELNHDINVLRIFNDYIEAIKTAKPEQQVQTGIDNFKNKFDGLRKEIDELRHLMHLNKMKIAAESRQGAGLADEELNADNHLALERRYIAFADLFNRIKNEFIVFESKWLK